MKKYIWYMPNTAMLFLIFICISGNAIGNTISGNIAYAGATTAVHLRVLAALEPGNGSSLWATNLSVNATAYTLTVPTNDTYWIQAFLDVNGDNICAPDEPEGISIHNPLALTNDANEENIAIYDGFSDMEGWYKSGNLIYDPATSNRNRIYTSGGGFAVSFPEREDTGGQCLRIDLLNWGYIFAYTQLGRHANGQNPAFGIVPRPGYNYKISFDACGDRQHRLLPLRWYNLAYVSDNPVRTKSHFYRQDAVLLSTNWQTYSTDIYFDHDDAFVRFGSTTDTNAYFQMMLNLPSAVLT